MNSPIISEMNTKVIPYGMAIIFNKALRDFRIQNKYAPLGERDVFINRELAERAYNKGFIACGEASKLWQEYKNRNWQPVRQEVTPFMALADASDDDRCEQSVGVQDYDAIEEVHGRRMHDETFDKVDWQALAADARRDLEAARIHTSSTAGQAAEDARTIKECLRDGSVDMNTIRDYLTDCYDELHSLQAFTAKCSRLKGTTNAPKATHAQYERIKRLTTICNHLENEIQGGRYGTVAESCFELERNTDD